MKRIPMVLVISMALVFMTANASLAGHMGQRQRNQHKRIAKGIRSGKITHGESLRLARQQWLFQQAKRRARADGWLSPQDKRRLDRIQDRASRHIYKAKHNFRYRGRAYSYPRPIYFFNPWIPADPSPGFSLHLGN